MNKRIHPAPTMSVLPGGCPRLKMSSLLMQYSIAPGMSGYCGRPPTAITIFFAVSSFFDPFFIVAIIVCASLNSPRPLIYSIFLSLRSTLVTQFTDLMWFCTDSVSAAQLILMSFSEGTCHPYATASCNVN